MPLLVRWPGVLPAGRDAGFASLIDLPASILTAARAPVPASYAGLDVLSPLVLTSTGRVGSGPSPYEPLPCEAPPAASKMLTSGRICVAATDLWGVALVTERFKLTYYPRRAGAQKAAFGADFGGEVRLFDLKADPHEHIDVWPHDRWKSGQPREAEATEAARLGPLLLEALLRWRAGQVDLAQASRSGLEKNCSKTFDCRCAK